MSKDVSEKVSLELTLLAALDSVHADVDTSKIAEIQDWSRAVRRKFYRASVRKPSRLSKFKAGLLSALKRPKAADAPHSSPGGFRGVITAASGNVASHGSVQYSQMAIPQLIAVCASESSEEAWIEFVRRSQPLITTVITRALRRSGNVSNQLVDDLIQDVYLKIVSHGFRALRSFEMLQENSFFSFLKIVATNTVQDYSRRVSSARRGAREAPKAGLVFMDPESGRGPSSKLEREILLREIDRILIRCSHEPNFVRDHAIFWLYFSQGLTAKEIAGLPGVKLGVKGVESTLLRLTEQVKAALTQETKKPNRSL